MRYQFVVACVSVLVGCSTARTESPQTRITIANTPEGMACWRECEGIYYSCTAGCKPPPSLVVGPRCRADCAEARERCQLTCPGATRVNVEQ